MYIKHGICKKEYTLKAMYTLIIIICHYCFVVAQEVCNDFVMLLKNQ